MGYMFEIWHDVFLECETDINGKLAELDGVLFMWKDGKVTPLKWSFDSPLIDFTRQLNEMRILGVRGQITLVGEIGDHTKYKISGFSVDSVRGWVQYWTKKEYRMPQNESWRIRIHRDGQRGSIYRLFFHACNWQANGDEIVFGEEFRPVPQYVKRKVKSLSKLARAWAEIPKILP